MFVTNDKECFKWCLIIYVNPTNKDLARFIKSDKNFSRKFDFKDIKFPVKIRDICIIKKIVSVLMFLVIRLDNNFKFIFQNEDFRMVCSFIIDRSKRPIPLYSYQRL